MATPTDILPGGLTTFKDVIDVFLDTRLHALAPDELDEEAQHVLSGLINAVGVHMNALNVSTEQLAGLASRLTDALHTDQESKIFAVLKRNEEILRGICEIEAKNSIFGSGSKSGLDANFASRLRAFLESCLEILRLTEGTTTESPRVPSTNTTQTTVAGNTADTQTVVDADDDDDEENLSASADAKQKITTSTAKQSINERAASTKEKKKQNKPKTRFQIDVQSESSSSSSTESSSSYSDSSDSSDDAQQGGGFGRRLLGTPDQRQRAAVLGQMYSMRAQAGLAPHSVFDKGSVHDASYYAELARLRQSASAKGLRVLPSQYAHLEQIQQTWTYFDLHSPTPDRFDVWRDQVIGDNADRRVELNLMRLSPALFREMQMLPLPDFQGAARLCGTSALKQDQRLYHQAHEARVRFTMTELYVVTNDRAIELRNEIAQLEVDDDADPAVLQELRAEEYSVQRQSEMYLSCLRLDAIRTIHSINRLRFESSLPTAHKKLAAAGPSEAIVNEDYLQQRKQYKENAAALNLNQRKPNNNDNRNKNNNKAGKKKKKPGNKKQKQQNGKYQPTRRQTSDDRRYGRDDRRSAERRTPNRSRSRSRGRGSSRSRSPPNRRRTWDDEDDDRDDKTGNWNKGKYEKQPGQKGQSNKYNKNKNTSNKRQ